MPNFPTVIYTKDTEVEPIIIIQEHTIITKAQERIQTMALIILLIPTRKRIGKALTTVEMMTPYMKEIGSVKDLANR